MEKYEKPVMVLEEIVDEIHTYAVYPDTVMVSGESSRTNITQNLVPGSTNVP